MQKGTICSSAFAGSERRIFTSPWHPQVASVYPGTPLFICANWGCFAVPWFFATVYCVWHGRTQTCGRHHCYPRWSLTPGVAVPSPISPLLHFRDSTAPFSFPSPLSLSNKDSDSRKSIEGRRTKPLVFQITRLRWIRQAFRQSELYCRRLGIPLKALSSQHPLAEVQTPTPAPQVVDRQLVKQGKPSQGRRQPDGKRYPRTHPTPFTRRPPPFSASYICIQHPNSNLLLTDRKSVV